MLTIEQAFWTGLLVAVLGGGISIWLHFVKKVRWQYVGMTATVTVWLALWILRLPVSEAKEGLSLWENILLAALDALRFFTLEQRHEPLPDILTAAAGVESYFMLETVLSVAAAVCTATILLSVLRWFGKVKLLCIWRPVYYFSELNEKSFVLAQNIYHQWKQSGKWFCKPILAFCKETLSEEGEEPGLRSEAKKMDAVFYPDPIYSINKASPWWRTVKVFLMDTDENANMSAALKMKDWIAREKGGHLPGISVDSDLLVFSTEESGEFLFDKLLSTVKHSRVQKLMEGVSDADIANTLMHEAMKKLQQQEEEARNKEKNPVPKAQEPAQEKKPLIDPETQARVDALAQRLMARVLSHQPDHDDPRHRQILQGRLKGTALGVVKDSREPEEKLCEAGWEMLREEVATGRFDREDSSIDLHLVNETKFIAQKLLWEHPLYRAERDCKVSMLIVGGGRLGTEILRAAMVCGTMYHCKLETVVVDLDAKRLEKQFHHEYPYLKTSLKESVTFCQADVTTTEFDEVLKQHCLDCRYIVVATGDDERNMITAQFLRRWYARQEIGKDSRDFGQQIYVAIRSSERHETLSALGRENMTLFGCNTQMFSPEELLDRHVDRMAMWYNLCYKGGKWSKKLFPESEAAQQEYKREAKRAYCRLISMNQRSNQLLALHCLYKLWDLRRFEGISDAEPDTRKQLAGLLYSLKEHYDVMGELEHERWEVFQRINGWGPFEKEKILPTIKTDPHQNGHKHTLALLHGCLISFGELEQLAKDLQTRDFRLNDKAMCVASLLVWVKEVRAQSADQTVRETAQTAIDTMRDVFLYMQNLEEDEEVKDDMLLQWLCNSFPQ